MIWKSKKPNLSICLVRAIHDHSSFIEIVLFIGLVLEEGDQEWAETGQLWSKLQRTEFQEMDEDNDGYLTRDELLVGVEHSSNIQTHWEHSRMHIIHWIVLTSISK